MVSGMRNPCGHFVEVGCDCAELETLKAKLARCEAALTIAREQGEHYPVCGIAPHEAMKDRAAWLVWQNAKLDAFKTPERKRAWWKENCVCWKTKMEAALD